MSIKLSWKVNIRMRVYLDLKPQRTTVSLILGRPVHQDDIVSWESGLESIAKAINHGALCGDVARPAHSFFRPIIVEPIKDEGLSLQFEVAGIDPGGWRVVTGLMVMATYGSPKAEVQILSTRSAQEKPDVIDDKVWDFAFPAIPSELPFSLEREEPNPSSYDILLRIRFRNGLSEAQAAEVISALEAWSSMLFGGYAEDGTDIIDCSVDSQEVFLVDPRTVEYAAAYTGAEAGLDAAVLVGLWLHDNLSPVEVVTIE